LIVAVAADDPTDTSPAPSPDAPAPSTDGSPAPTDGGDAAAPTGGGSSPAPAAPTTPTPAAPTPAPTPAATPAATDGGVMSGRVCDKGFVEVADGYCCPKSSPAYYNGRCYTHCDPMHDDFILGSFVACRERCNGGYASSVNECTRGVHVVTRSDTPRDSGVAATKQQSPFGGHECPKHHRRVPLNEDGSGGCCPDKWPYWINGVCYGTCADGDHTDQREIMIHGNMVACRTHCSLDATETTNKCEHPDSGDDSTDRGDFPRAHHPTVDRLHAKPIKASNGCPDGYVRASNLRCCPTTEPNLIGLLCYENCKVEWESRDFGCHKHCKPGWTELRHTCEKDGVPTKNRKTYERNPVLPKFRLTI